MLAVIYVSLNPSFNDRHKSPSSKSNAINGNTVKLENIYGLKIQLKIILLENLTFLKLSPTYKINENIIIPNVIKNILRNSSIGALLFLLPSVNFNFK